MRAAHTLCGIHRTGGFPLVATVAKALEACLLGLQERGAPLPGTAQPVLARAIAGLTAFSGRVRARDGFRAADEAEGAEIIAELDALRQETRSRAGGPRQRNRRRARGRGRRSNAAATRARCQHAAACRDICTRAPDAGGGDRPIPDRSRNVQPRRHPRVFALSPRQQPPRPPRRVHHAADETLAHVHDDVDRQVLPIFLEEAAELFPQTGEQLRAWRRKPADKDVVPRRCSARCIRSRAARAWPAR